MKEILMKLQNCMFIRINHTLIPFDEKFSKIKYFLKDLFEIDQMVYRTDNKTTE